MTTPRLLLLGAFIAMTSMITTLAFMPKCPDNAELKNALVTIIKQTNEAKTELTKRLIKSIDDNDRVAAEHEKAAKLFQDRVNACR